MTDNRCTRGCGGRYLRGQDLCYSCGHGPDPLQVGAERNRSDAYVKMTDGKAGGFYREGALNFTRVKYIPQPASNSFKTRP